MRFKFLKRVVFILLVFYSCYSMSQQVADTSLVAKIENPYHTFQSGPLIYIDEMHHNFHTMEGRFKPFSDVMKSDGYNVKSLTRYDLLKSNDILVISNAIHQKNVGNWAQPIHDAFNTEEITLLKNWVASGGRLLIIADHMPFSGATNTLANAFGFDFCDGFAQLSQPTNKPDTFSEENLRLIPSIITDGSFGKKLHSVTTFTGSSFEIPKNAIGILKFLKGDTCLQPKIAWQFDDDTPTKDLELSLIHI